MAYMAAKCYGYWPGLCGVQSIRDKNIRRAMVAALITHKTRVILGVLTVYKYGVYILSLIHI